ncbi:MULTISPECIES: zinc finger domain-containing protein [Nocardiopsis]|uniref:DNA-binding phage zinc finger domain-containing protein n=1 Tax=Nocardiopsis changdeensis TaxID=2831969 RepID=A0ABX8BWJ2_9ACTN|nr:MULTISPECIES: hypothetical protein [Nocardiopsis]QUX26343.1 hypothetical protein KGD84_32095 [Nocardiopsis changdeensis]QYX40837.1 hypothetical protein K1J57_33080 [Nocardiopsis sp. MT53]
MSETEPLTYPLLPLAVACPRCGSGPRQYCTSHGGTRLRRSDVHQDRTRAYRAPLSTARTDDGGQER